MIISFNVQSQTLIDDTRLRPRPAVEVLPDWKSALPAKVEQGLVSGRSARTCPAMHDFLHLGYVVPLWSDFRIERVSVDAQNRAYRDPNGQLIFWQSAHAAFPIEFHAREQVEGAAPLEPLYGIKKVVKPICPWLIETPPGWSILVLPLYLHEEAGKLPIEPLPGVVNTDHWHQVHAPCRWTNVQPTMTLKSGTPFMHVIPFRRDEALAPEFKLISEQARLANLAGVLTEFSGSYRRQQKVADDKRRTQEDEGGD